MDRHIYSGCMLNKANGGWSIVLVHGQTTITIQRRWNPNSTAFPPGWVVRLHVKGTKRIIRSDSLKADNTPSREMKAGS